jgi:hypothetical protein
MGRPTVVMATSKFAGLARQSAEQSGLPDARISVVAHPVGGVSKAELRLRGDAAVEDVLGRLLGLQGK